jgi:hypothetical protein
MHTEPESNARPTPSWAEPSVGTGRDKALPDGLSRLDELPALAGEQRRLLAQIQAHTYGNMLRVIECFAVCVADGSALPVHDGAFRFDLAPADDTPPGYRFVVPVDAVALAAAGRCGWARHGLALAVALQAQAHYRASIEPDDDLAEHARVLFLGNWRRVAPRAREAERAWLQADRLLDGARRDAAIIDLLALVVRFDAAVRAQAAADARCFLDARPGAVGGRAIRALLLRAYRWQYVGIGLQEARFVVLLQSLLDGAQLRRVRTALAPLLAAVR